MSHTAKRIVWWQDGLRFVVSEFCEAESFIRFVRFLKANEIKFSVKKETIQ
jgi:hypothetical protein